MLVKNSLVNATSLIGVYHLSSKPGYPHGSKWFNIQEMTSHKCEAFLTPYLLCNTKMTFSLLPSYCVTKVRTPGLPLTGIINANVNTIG